MTELAYPFAEKEAQYSEYTLDMLDHALRDAREASERAEDMAREMPGLNFGGRKGPGWRADDVHTIAKIRQRKLGELGLLGTIITFD